MNPISGRFIICGVDEVSNYRLYDITHMVSITNPKSHIIRPSWFTGEHIELYFGDVISKSDAAQYNTIAPSFDDVSRAVTFIREAWNNSNAKILIHCDYGASRSPAIAYVALAGEMGSGAEDEALQIILKIRPDAVPNKLIVQLGDGLLQRDGQLLVPLHELYRQVSEELSIN